MGRRAKQVLAGTVVLAVAAVGAVPAGASERDAFVGAPPSTEAIAGQASGCASGTLIDPDSSICAPISDRVELASTSNSLTPPGLDDLRADRSITTNRTDQASNSMPVPGGIGAGITFRNGTLQALDHADLRTTMYVQPDGVDASGPGMSWLFSTSTNRTQKGVEVVAIYYELNPDGSLGVFDWSCSPQDPCEGGETGPSWIWTRYLTDFACNMTDIVDQGGHVQTVMHYSNQTLRLHDGTPDSWRNAVYLWNFCDSGWDQVYEHDYAGSQIDCSANGSCGWWGPILETFSDALPEIDELGFEDTSLLHDGVWSDLSPSETFFSAPTHPWPLNHLDPNRGFGVGNHVVDASCTHRALFVAGTAPVPSGDRSLFDAVVTKVGEHCVEVADDYAVTVEHAERFDVVVVSSSVTPSVLGDRLRDAIVPILVSEPHLFDDMSMVEPGGGRELGAKDSIYVSDPAHPLAAGRSGWVRVYTAPTGLNYGVRPAAGVERVATRGPTSARMTLFALPAGGTLADGQAPHARVGFFAAYGAELSADGIALVHAALDWLARTATPTGLFVAGNDRPPKGDAQIAALIERAGVEVTFVDDDSDLAAIDVGEYDVVFISTTVRPNAVGNVFRNAPVPVVTWEAYLFDDLGMAVEARATPRARTTLTIVDSSHPLAAGLGSGNHVVQAPARKMMYGVPGHEADVVAHELNHPDRAVVFAYEAGAALVDAGTAPALRVGLFPVHTSALTESGERIIQATIDAALS